MDPFSAKHRSAFLEQATQQTFDVLVIGGGITGAGIALDAVSRGLKVALVEMQDFAAGTSSRSTRLIHGGLRYLKQFEFKFVSEVARERAIIHRNAPHLVTPEPILLPITKNGSLGRSATRLGMWLYERLAGVKREERHQALSASETLSREPLLKKENLLGGILYYEYHTDDARLTISVLKEAVSRGALALSYLKVTGFTYEDGKITGIEAEDQLQAAVYKIRSNYVINASGPWIDTLDRLDDKAHGHKLQLTKGVHLVVDHSKLPLKQSVYIDTDDKRMIFVIPHRRKTYIGTTDTFYDGDLRDPLISAEDTSYLLNCVNNYFADHRLTPDDIESGWAGIRPLIRKDGKKPSEISRKEELFVWDSGLITIAGGKLTGYRKMARQVVDLLAGKIAATEQKKLPACSTDRIILSGGKTGPVPFAEFIKYKALDGLALGLNAVEIETLINRYGSEIGKLYKILEKLKQGPASFLPPALHGELIYAMEHEMCLTPSDFFIRRSGMLYFDMDAVKRNAPAVVRHMQDLLHWDHETTQRHERALQQAILNARH